MTGSENRGEKQPGRMQLQTGPNRDAIAKSVMVRTSLSSDLLREKCRHTIQDGSSVVNPFFAITDCHPGLAVRHLIATVLLYAANLHFSGETSACRPLPPL